MNVAGISKICIVQLDEIIVIFSELNPLNPQDALKYYFAFLKNDLNKNFYGAVSIMAISFCAFATNFRSSSSTTSRELRCSCDWSHLANYRLVVDEYDFIHISFLFFSQVK